MLALLKKDWIVAVKYSRMVLLMMLLFTAVGLAVPKDAFYVIFPLVMCSALTVSLIAYDERFRWDRYCETVPISRALCVSEKYLIHALLTGLITLLCGIGLARHYAPDAPEFLSTLLVMLIAALLLPGLMFPLIFKLGTEKGRIYYFVVLFLGIGLSYVVSDAMRYSVTLAVGPGFCAAAAAALIVLYLLSWRLSIRLYERREL